MIAIRNRLVFKNKQINVNNHIFNVTYHILLYLIKTEMAISLHLDYELSTRPLKSK
jgi:hypothetical protein